MYRTIDVGIWQEMWFEELAPSAKLLFFYLLTNSRQTACGAFRVSLRSICHETNLTVDEATVALADLARTGKVQWWPNESRFVVDQSWMRPAAPVISPERRRWRDRSKTMRPRILERDGYQCLQCGATDDLTIDHIQPLSRGGRHGADNLQTLCRSCNSRKGAR